MATVTAAVTISSAAGSLYTSALSFTNTVDITTLNTEGLSKATITQTTIGATCETLYTAGAYVAPAYIFIKNTETTAGNFIYVYDDTNSDTTILKLEAGDWAYMPLMATATLKAYGTTANFGLEYMVFGTQTT